MGRRGQGTLKRRFGDLVYHAFNLSETKREATAVANRIRISGRKARVTPSAEGYKVWIHN